MAKQGFSSLFTHQEEELRDDKKRQQQQLQKRLRWNPVNTTTNGPWKSIRIDGSKSISLTCTSHSRSFTPPITQSDQTEEETSKLINKRPPRTD